MSTIELVEPEVKTVALETAPAALPTVQPQPQATGRQLSVVEYAMQNGASAAEVKALVELQIQMDNHKLAMLKQQDEREREQRKVAAEMAFRSAFAAFRGENVIIPKSKHVDRGRAGSFNQAEFDAVMGRLSPALSKHGFGIRHDQKFGTREWPTAENPHAVIGWVWVTCFLEHRDGHAEHLVLEGPQDDQSANTPVQNMQATASYLKRQSTLAITGTPTGGEDDENKLRPKGQQAETNQDERERVIETGRNAAMEGTASLNKWWGSLTGKQRNDLQGEFTGMRKAARAADDKGGAQ